MLWLKLNMVTHQLFRRVGAKRGSRIPADCLIDFDRHRLGRDKFSAESREIVDVLRSKGFEAYVVGGAVRDLLVGLTPSDEDIVTDAKPEWIAQFFKRSYVIGRRHKLVHIHKGRKIFEVST